MFIKLKIGNKQRNKPIEQQIMINAMKKTKA